MASAAKRTLTDYVLDKLGRDILSGVLAEGTIIEVDKLESELGVSRTVVREAIKVLSSKGLVAARPKYGTYVRKRSVWKLLDADVMSWRDHGRPDPELLRDLQEMRFVVEPAAARLAAQRRTDEQVAEIERALATLGGRNVDVVEHVAADLAFHRTILAATGNELLGRLEVVLQFALGIRDRLAYSAPHTDEYLTLHAAVAAAIRDRDPDAAERSMHQLLSTAVSDDSVALSDHADSAAAAPVAVAIRAGGR